LLLIIDAVLDSGRVSGMTGATPASAPSRLFGGKPSSVGEARKFIRHVLAGTDVDLVDSAELLTSELVTNAVLHANGDVRVRAWATADRVHVRVSDSNAERSPVTRPRDTDAATGRGLQLVEMIAASYGVEPSPDGKTVWFEIWSMGPPPSAEREWQASLTSNPGPTKTITLRDLPTGLFRAAQRHRDALLRECKLQALSRGEVLGFTAEALLEAGDANSVITDCVGGEIGSGDGGASRSVAFSVPDAVARGVASLALVLEAANTAAREGLFLTRPALPEIRLFRAWLLSEITHQLNGSDPISWPVFHQQHAAEYGEHGQHETPEWQRTGIVHDDVATITADENNIITAVNAAAATLLGWEPGDLIGQRILAVIPSQWQERHVVGFTNFLLTGESRIIGTPVTVPALHASGVTVEVTLLLRVEQTQNGRTLFVAQLTSATEPAASA
jgi:PAS domain S-box-containing protein